MEIKVEVVSVGGEKVFLYKGIKSTTLSAATLLDTDLSVNKSSETYQLVGRWEDRSAGPILDSKDYGIDFYKTFGAHDKLSSNCFEDGDSITIKVSSTPENIFPGRKMSLEQQVTSALSFYPDKHNRPAAGHLTYEQTEKDVKAVLE